MAELLSMPVSEERVIEIFAARELAG